MRLLEEERGNSALCRSLLLRCCSRPHAAPLSRTLPHSSVLHTAAICRTHHYCTLPHSASLIIVALCRIHSSLLHSAALCLTHHCCTLPHSAAHYTTAAQGSLLVAAAREHSAALRLCCSSVRRGLMQARSVGLAAEPSVGCRHERRHRSGETNNIAPTVEDSEHLYSQVAV
jgi:hypothetical protein